LYFSLYQNVKEDVSAMILYPRFKALKLTGHKDAVGTVTHKDGCR